MALLPILRYPDPRLAIVAQPVPSVDDAIRRLIDAMTATMYAADGIGLAATQVDVHLRVIVVDVTEDRSGLMALINPVITRRGGSADFEEGCLSVPGIYDSVIRAAWVRVRALDRHGNPCEMQAEGLLAMVLQHEIDHLQGMVFVEHLPLNSQQRIRARLEKQPPRKRK